MSKIEWDSSLSVHVPEIDAQHRKWISIINEVHDLLLSGHDFTETTIQVKLLEMQQYGRMHFTFEEQYMERIGHPSLEEHREEHSRFLVELEGYISNSQQLLPSELMKILMDWLMNHILVHDRKYHFPEEPAESTDGLL